MDKRSSGATNSRQPSVAHAKPLLPDAKRPASGPKRAAWRIPNNRFLRLMIYPVGLIPAAWIFYLAITNQLSANPVKSTEQLLGLWGLRFLILTLLVTPLRELFRINFLPYRRALGLLAFYYICLHFLVYLALDKMFSWSQIFEDITKRTFIIIGFSAFILLIPLALTSNRFAIRRLGHHWQSLHKLVYLIIAAGAVHFILSVKSWPPQPLIYAAIIACLLAWRLPVFRKTAK